MYYIEGREKRKFPLDKGLKMRYSVGRKELMFENYKIETHTRGFLELPKKSAPIYADPYLTSPRSANAQETASCEVILPKTSLIRIVGLKKVPNKNGETLSFTLIYYPDDSREEFYIGIRGFRLMDGHIHSPASKFGHKWVDICVFGKEFAECIYEGLRRKLEESEEFKGFKLNNLEDAIELLHDKKFVNRLRNE